MGTPRIVFLGGSEDFDAAAESALPLPCVFRPARFVPGGSAAYVALKDSDLARYDARFKGVMVRVAARLRATPLQPGGAMYLPVAFDSWVVVCDGPSALGAALYAVSRIGSYVGSVVCPAFDPELLPAAAASLTRAYVQFKDRILEIHHAAGGRDAQDRGEADAVGREVAPAGPPVQRSPGA